MHVEEGEEGEHQHWGMLTGTYGERRQEGGGERGVRNGRARCGKAGLSAGHMQCGPWEYSDLTLLPRGWGGAD